MHEQSSDTVTDKVDDEEMRFLMFSLGAIYFCLYFVGRYLYIVHVFFYCILQALLLCFL